LVSKCCPDINIIKLILLYFLAICLTSVDAFFIAGDVLPEFKWLWEANAVPKLISYLITQSNKNIEGYADIQITENPEIRLLPSLLRIIFRNPDGDQKANPFIETRDQLKRLVMMADSLIKHGARTYDDTLVLDTTDWVGAKYISEYDPKEMKLSDMLALPDIQKWRLRDSVVKRGNDHAYRQYGQWMLLQQLKFYSHDREIFFCDGENHPILKYIVKRSLVDSFKTLVRNIDGPADIKLPFSLPMMLDFLLVAIFYEPDIDYKFDPQDKTTADLIKYLEHLTALAEVLLENGARVSADQLLILIGGQKQASGPGWLGCTLYPCTARKMLELDISEAPIQGMPLFALHQRCQLRLLKIMKKRMEISQDLFFPSIGIEMN
jgi:hypothetical protein